MAELLLLGFVDDKKVAVSIAKRTPRPISALTASCWPQPSRWIGISVTEIGIEVGIFGRSFHIGYCSENHLLPYERKSFTLTGHFPYKDGAQ